MLECAYFHGSIPLGDFAETKYGLYTKDMYSEQGTLQNMPAISYPKHPSEKLFNETQHAADSSKYQGPPKSSFTNYGPIEKETEWNYNLTSSISSHVSAFPTPITTTCSDVNDERYLKEPWLNRPRKDSFSPNNQDNLHDAGQRINSCKKTPSFAEPGSKMIKHNAHAGLLENGRSLESRTVTRLLSRSSERVAPLTNEISSDVRQSSMTIGGSEMAVHSQSYHLLRQSSETTTCGSSNTSIPNFGYSASHNFPASSLHIDGTNLSQDGFIISSGKISSVSSFT